MWHGHACRLHAGTVAYLSGLGNDVLDDQPCVVRGYHGVNRGWIVKLQNPDFEGKELIVAEENLVLAHAIIPANADAEAVRRRSQATVSVVITESCGRGLVAAAPCFEDTVLFEEHPFLITPTGVNNMWRERWRVFLMLRMAAQQGDANMQKALQAFESLTPGDERREGVPRSKVDEAAAAMVQEAVRMYRASGQGEMDEDARAEQETQIAQTLRRFQANQFLFANGLKYSASGVYIFTSLMNHSCVPTVAVKAEWADLREGSFNRSDGRVVVRSVRRLQTGEPLCFNYGPKALLGWPLEKRREYLQEKNGFFCRCPRCVAEEESGPTAAAEASQPDVSAP